MMVEKSGEKIRTKTTDGKSSIESRRRTVARLKSEGKTTTEMATRLKVSTTTINRDLKWLREHELNAPSTHTDKNENNADETAEPRPEDTNTGIIEPIDDVVNNAINSEANVSDEDTARIVMDTVTLEDDIVTGELYTIPGDADLKALQETVGDTTSNGDDAIASTVYSNGDSVNNDAGKSEHHVDDNDDEGWGAAVRFSASRVFSPVHIPDTTDADTSILEWWDGGSSTVGDAARRMGTFKHASRGAVREAGREEWAALEYDSVPDEEQYRYLRMKIREARAEVAVGASFIAMMLTMFVIIAVG